MPPSSDVAAFHAVLTQSRNPRIMALCGAGLSASSGLPTFRGAGGLWRNHDAKSLATPTAFASNPAQVWFFYAYRRHMSLQAKPNAAHHALAALAKKRDNFLCLTQNVDNLSQRAGHPLDRLRTLHGSLFTIKCWGCDHKEHNNTMDPLVPALAAAAETAPTDPTRPFPLLDPSTPLPHVDRSELPQCPKCQDLLRPGVVWFGEPLDYPMLDGIDNWIREGPVDLMLVIGTSSSVWPAAAYIEKAEAAGARVCVVNMDIDWDDLTDDDFAFEGDAADILPRLLEPVIGKSGGDGTFDEAAT